MATKRYLMFNVDEGACKNGYQDVLRDLITIPEVQSIERLDGIFDLMVQVECPATVGYAAADDLSAKGWVKRLEVLQVEPFKPHDYVGLTLDDLIRLKGLIPESPGNYEGLTVDERLRIKRLIHESRGSHGPVSMSP
jgi:hypothetical protein